MAKKTSEKSKIAYTDRKGHNWSRTNLEDLIRGYAHFRRFMEISEHYKGRFE
jgi:hypothetical protein